jgi:pyridoxal phosphate enzyme (YggS family)
MTEIAENYKKIRTRIDEIAQKSGRNPKDVKLMAVSKFHTVDEIVAAILGGARLFGENRVQEAVEKFPALFSKYPDIQLELIGQLQTNKVKQIIPYATCIQSIDRIKVIEEIEKKATIADKKVRILFEIHTGEESKSGFTDTAVLEKAIDLSSKMSHIIPSGFMTMAPFTEDKEIIRDSFRQLRELSEDMQKKFSKLDLHELSMGMSNDYEIAVEEGSTLVRVGTAIFGHRSY